MAKARARISLLMLTECLHTLITMRLPLFNTCLIVSLLCLLHSIAYGQKGTNRNRTPPNPVQLARKACLPAKITVDKTILCAGESLELSSPTLPSYTYRWFKDGAVVVGEASPVLTIDTPGTYKLEITNTASPNCVETDQVVIRQSPLKKVSIVPLTQQIACEGGSLVAAIDAGTSNPASTSLTYNWQRNGILLPGNGPTIQASEPGNYTVFVVDADCRAAAGPVEVFTKPKPEFPAVPTVCAGTVDQLALKATPAGGVFSGEGVRNGLFMPKLAGPGQHTVTYSVTSATGCRTDVSQPIQVLTVPQPDLGPNQTIVAGSQVVLQGPTGPNLTYTWDPIAGLLTDDTADTDGRLNLQRVVAQPTATTTYHLTVSQNSDCPMSSSVVITVLPGLFFPSAFTPNDDGQNDVWTIVGIDAFPLASVQIYNRWGELIVNESPYSQPWDGRIRGERVAPGPYRYIIRPSPSLPERSGTLTVLN